MLSFPPHSSGDPCPSAGMIEKDELFEWTGIKLTIFSQQHVHIRLAVWLLRRIQTIHVRLVFHGPRDGIGHRRQEKEVEGQYDHCQRQNGDVADSSDIPLLTPACKTGLDAPVQEGEPDHD